MTRLIAFALLAVFAVSSCKKDNDSTTIDIIGKWKWVETSGGIGQVHIRPEPGSLYIFEFKANNTYRYTRNGSVLIEGVYTVERRMSYLYNRIMDMVIFDNSSWGEILTIDHNELSLVTDAVDPMGSRYIRYNY